MQRCRIDIDILLARIHIEFLLKYKSESYFYSTGIEDLHYKFPLISMLEGETSFAHHVYIARFYNIWVKKVSMWNYVLFLSDNGYNKATE